MADETFKDVIAALNENKTAQLASTDDLKDTIVASAKTTNRSFGQSLAKQFGKQIGLQQDALEQQASMLAEQERIKLLEQQNQKTKAVEGKDLGGGVFAKSLSGLKVLIGSVGLFFLGILGIVKALQNVEFRDAVKDLFGAMKDVFVFIKDEVFVPLMPILESILTYTVIGLTKGFELVLETFKLIKDFGENGPKPEEYKGLPALGIGLATMFNKLMDPEKGIIGKFIARVKAGIDLGTRSVTRFFTGGKGLSLFGETGLITKIKGIFRPVTNLAAGLTKLPVISSFTSFFSKTGGFMKMLGKLFLPFTIVIAAFDTIKGIIDGVLGAEGETQVGPAGMTSQKPSSFMDKLMGGIKGGLKGLVNSLVGMPLDFLKNAVAWVLGKFGFTGAEEGLQSFSFVETFNSIFEAIFNPIDTIKTLVQNLAEKLNIPSFEEMKKKLNDFRKKIFSTSEESESGRPEIFGFAIPELPSISGMFDKLLELRNKVYNPETGEIFGMSLPSLPSFNLPNIGDMLMNMVGGMLPDPDGGFFARRFYSAADLLGFDSLRTAAEAFHGGGVIVDGVMTNPNDIEVPGQNMNVGTGPQNVIQMTPDELREHIEDLERAADTAGNLDDFATESRLMDRIEELNRLRDDAIMNDRQTVTVVNADNKQTQINQQGNTVSIAKETTPNDNTMRQLQLQYGGAF